MIVSALNEKYWTRRDLGYIINRAIGIKIHPKERPGRQKSAGSEHRWKMTAFGNLTFQNGDDIGKGAV